MTTNTKFVEQLNSLILEPRKQGLDPVRPRGVLPGRTGVATPDTAVGGGISSPLTEPDAGTRTYHAAYSLTSSDGLLVFEVEPLATMDMTDADGGAVQFIFADPAA
jgi:hypothetical protein